MKEDEPMPRADGLRHDDPPFRSYFTEQSLKPSVVMEQQRQAYQRRVEPKLQPIPDEPEVTVMTDNVELVTTIRRIAAGGRYVNVDKLIEELTCIK